jgi:hypothetical protein
VAICCKMQGMARVQFWVFACVAGALVVAGCAKPEKKVTGLWSGSAMITIPKTGDPTMDARFANAKPEKTDCLLKLQEDKTYTENFDGFGIEGTWVLKDKTVTLTPKAVDGNPVDTLKQQLRAAAKESDSKTIPGMNGSEEVPLSDDGKTLTVKALGSQIELHPIADPNAL